jgi:hypothetical protein
VPQVAIALSAKVIRAHASSAIEKNGEQSVSPRVDARSMSIFRFHARE